MSISTREYLNSDIITKIDNLFLRAKLVVEGFMIGLHKSPYHGFSVEFSEHRAYGYGDEIKYIDWKLWAKTDKLFIKQFEEETNLKAHILIDQSNSVTKVEIEKLINNIAIQLPPIIDETCTGRLAKVFEELSNQ